MVLAQEVPVNGDLATITFTATSQMSPKSRLVVYAIRASNQEILADATDFQVDGLFRNNVCYYFNLYNLYFSNATMKQEKC